MGRATTRPGGSDTHRIETAREVGEGKATAVAVAVEAVRTLAAALAEAAADTKSTAAEGEVAVMAEVRQDCYCQTCQATHTDPRAAPTVDKRAERVVGKAEMGGMVRTTDCLAAAEGRTVKIARAGPGMMTARAAASGSVMWAEAGTSTGSAEGREAAECHGGSWSQTMTQGCWTAWAEAEGLVACHRVSKKA